MSEEERIQFVIRCQFNAFCKKAIKNRAAELKRKNKNRWLNEFYFEDLSPAEQEGIQAVDEVIDDDVKHFFVDGKTFSSSLIQKAIESLPSNKQAVINLYFFDELTEMEIGNLLGITRSSVWYRKDSSLKKIKEFLEEHRHDKE